MQYVPGVDGAELAAREPLAAERAVHIVEQAARGLDEAHRAGLIHRDVKPANLLIDARPGQPDRVLVGDFGIGRSVVDSTALTAAGTVLATLAYAAPEQLAGERVDHRADVYALGATLYQLLTGTTPFPHPTAAAVIQAHLTEAPPRPTAIRPELPPGLDAVIARAMDKDPGRRYASCGALAADARAACTAAPVPGDTPRRFPVRRRVGIAIAAAVVAALGVATAIALQGNSSPGTATPGAAPTSVPAAAGASSSSPTTSAAPAASWGSYSFVAKTFPGLLPASPDTAGYQGMRCGAVDDNGKPSDTSVPVTGFVTLACNGDKQPLNRLKVTCDTDRESWPAPALADDTVSDGAQSWNRSSSNGRMVWGHFYNSDRTKSAGELVIGFDDPGHSFCVIFAFAEPDAKALVDTWWPNLPL
ncbi:serine/threonine-protein kinase [Nocardia seriolae]|uniref:non-specific serine/threonine protein kinase n=1 Tax=Nocardia seriolae TaxID=37332 RepID=A0ABC8B029_9NOCA|nr:serine/threonine-protein kinase [Nocardia seriolae]APA99835.1 Non-specific serine/threonine protein kinase [Nocardia seriolae]MTJ64533.1 protein kinase [Nocardia seriolae]MTJ74581.1 protein kinase [Nocardia seriolae]MTJ89377.1 protein kinase [Nocardia seriolae]OJF79730.1 hypothetical protein NS14008_11655 [Nocardia seriolae]